MIKGFFSITREICQFVIHVVADKFFAQMSMSLIYKDISILSFRIHFRYYRTLFRYCVRLLENWSFVLLRYPWSSLHIRGISTTMVWRFLSLSSLMWVSMFVGPFRGPCCDIIKLGVFSTVQLVAVFFYKLNC